MFGQYSASLVFCISGRVMIDDCKLVQRRLFKHDCCRAVFRGMSLYQVFYFKLLTWLQINIVQIIKVSISAEGQNHSTVIKDPPSSISG